MSVEQNLEEIMSARYGKDVRQSIHDAIYDINEVAKRAEFDASTAPASAKAYAEAALASEQAAQSAKQAAEEAAQQAMSGTPAGYADLVEEVRSLKVSSDTVLAEAGTFVGRVLLDKMYGMSIQDGTPTPSVPVAINSAKANFSNCGKNLLQVTSPSTTVNNVTFTVNSDSTITVSTTASGASALATLKIGTIHSKLVTNSLLTKAIKLSGCPSGGSASTYRLDFFRNDNAEYGNGITLNVGANVGVDGGVRIVIFPNTVITTPITFKPMVTLADVTDQTFEPYQGQSVTTDLTLRAIEVTSSDNYNLVKDGHYYVADTLEKIDGGYQITRRIKDIEIDGTESGSWQYGTNQGNNFYLWKYNSVYPTAKYSRLLLSDRFIPQNTSFNWGNIITGGDGWFVFYDNDLVIAANDVSALKTWLGTNKPHVAYILATPTVEIVSDADAKKLLSLKSYDEATYVAQTEDTEGVMVLEYGTTNYATKALSGYVEAEQNSIRLDVLEA